MEDKNEKEIKRFSYERPVLVNLSSSDFELYQGGNQCSPGSGAAITCAEGAVAGSCAVGVVDV